MKANQKPLYSEKFIFGIFSILITALCIMGYLHILDGATVGHIFISLISLMAGVLLGKNLSG